MTRTDQDLFDPSPQRSVAPVEWYLVTNQLNLMFMLAAGLVTGPTGFGGKYYRDPLAGCPGWIPLFAGPPPRAALEECVREGRHLRAVAAQVDLSRLGGPMRAMTADGAVRELDFPEGLTGDEAVLFIPAPLPAGRLAALLFPSTEARALCREEAGDYANVALDDFKHQVRARLFAGSATTLWPPAAETLLDIDRPVETAAAIGGAAAILFWLGNACEEAIDAARVLFESAEGDEVSDPLTRALAAWAVDRPLGEGDDSQAAIFRSTLEAVVSARGMGGGGAVPRDPHQVVLDHLSALKARRQDEKWQSALERLGTDLRGILGLGGDTVTSLLERHQRPLARGLMLFFLRDDCEALLDFRHPLLNGMDRVVAGALCGARAGWMAMPPRVRCRPGLAPAAWHRMAVRAHMEAGSGIDLGPAPPRPRTLREHLRAEPKGFSRRQREAALRLARGMGWSGLLHTRISLGRGQYRLVVDGAGAHVLLDGDVKAATTDVDMEALLARLAEDELPAKLDAELRTLLTG